MDATGDRDCSHFRIRDMAGRRHHTLPRFLLNGFASSKRGKHVYVWMYRKDGTEAELNTENVGVERDFYGGDQDGDLYGNHPKLDDRITNLETCLSKLVAALRNQQIDGHPLSDPLINDLISHLCIRSRQFRESITESTDHFIEQASDRLLTPGTMEQILSRELASGALELRIIGHLRDRGLSQTVAEKAVEAALQDRQALTDLLMSAYPETAAAMRGQMNLCRSMLKPAIKAANISSISNNLDSLGFAKLYEHHKWFLLDVDTLLLLGDSGCIFDTDGARRFRIFPDAGDHIKTIYLPISSTRLLIGSINNHPPDVEIVRLNKVIAKCSFDFFVAPRKLDVIERHLVKNIGKWAGIIGKKELVAILGDVFQEYN